MTGATEQRLVPRPDRGVIRHAYSVYGTSLEGIPLHVHLPDSGSAELLVIDLMTGRFELEAAPCTS